jgi:hypothetical protein
MNGAQQSSSLLLDATRNSSEIEALLSVGFDFLLFLRNTTEDLC